MPAITRSRAASPTPHVPPPPPSSSPSSPSSSRRPSGLFEDAPADHPTLSQHIASDPTILSPFPAAAVAKPPNFSGENCTFAEVLRFLFLLGNHFAILQVSPDLQTAVATSYLIGPALDWAIDNTFTGFADFSRRLKHAFIPYNHNLQAREALNHITQTTTVVNYVNRFRQACILVNDLDPAERFSRFSEGLKPNIRQHILIQNVTDFDTAAAMAIRVDMAFHPSTSTPNNSTTTPPPPRPPRLNAATIPTPTPTPISTSTYSSAPGPKPKLTDEARADLLRTGGCFYCRQPNHTVANCPTCPSNKSGNGSGTQ